MIENAIRAVLLADATIPGIVGTRIYPEELPQTCTLPAIAYSIITENEDSFGGVSNKRIQYSCYAASLDAAKALRQAVKNALKRYAGVIGGYSIISILPEPGGIVSKTPEAGLAMASRDFRVNYKGEQ